MMGLKKRAHSQEDDNTLPHAVSWRRLEFTDWRICLVHILLYTLNVAHFFLLQGKVSRLLCPKESYRYTLRSVIAQGVESRLQW